MGTPKHLSAMVAETKTIRFLDLFCGVGGFRIAAENALARLGYGTECVFSSDIDEFCRRSYEANFGERPFGDIAAKDAASVPDHDLLLAGFPCQPFSVIGELAVVFSDWK